MAATANLTLRQLEQGDVDKGSSEAAVTYHYRLHVKPCCYMRLNAGFLDLLAQLTVVGEISKSQFEGKTPVTICHCSHSMCHFFLLKVSVPCMRRAFSAFASKAARLPYCCTGRYGCGLTYLLRYIILLQVMVTEYWHVASSLQI